jgi:hypothetical protein
LGAGPDLVSVVRALATARSRNAQKTMMVPKTRQSVPTNHSRVNRPVDGQVHRPDSGGDGGRGCGVVGLCTESWGRSTRISPRSAS